MGCQGPYVGLREMKVGIRDPGASLRQPSVDTVKHRIGSSLSIATLEAYSSLVALFLVFILILVKARWKQSTERLEKNFGVSFLFPMLSVWRL